MVALAFFMLTTDYIGPQKDISECKSDKSISVICEISNPEDIVITPDNKYLLTFSLAVSDHMILPNLEALLY